MTLPSPRKRPITAPNTRAATKAKACLFAALILTTAAPSTATPGWRAARSAPEQVAHRKVVPAKPQASVQVAAAKVVAPVVRDTRVVRVAWEDYDPARQDFSAEAAGRSMLDKSVEVAVYDPFEAPTPDVEPPAEELRVAQLPDDPFDEPSFDDLLLIEPKADEAATAESELDQLDELNLLDDAAQGIDAELERREQQPSSLEGDNPFELPTMPSEEVEPLDDTLPFDARPNEENFEFGSGDQEQAWQTFTPEQREAIDRQLAEDKIAHQKECETLREYLSAEGIRDIDLKITVDGNPGEDYPFECGIGAEPYQPRQWSEITYMWTASRLYHKPLYFEQPQLERYGHTWGPFVQPIMSGAHFFGTVPFLPFAMGLEPPGECIYTLGHYRPGSCAPWLLETTPRNLRPYLFETGIGTGLFFLIP